MGEWPETSERGPTSGTGRGAGGRILSALRGVISPRRLLASVRYRAMRRGLWLPAAPEHVLIEPTNRCNLRCVMCANRKMKRPRGFMDEELFESVVEQSVKMGVYKVSLVGLGEPLLHPRLLDFVQMAKMRGVPHLYVSTNGQLLDEDRAAGLVDAGLDELKVSIEGTTAEEYEGVRVGGSFDRLQANLEALRRIRDRAGKSRPKISILSVLFKDTVGDRAAFERTWGGVADEIQFQPVSNQGGEMPEMDTHGVVPVTAGGMERRGPCMMLWSTSVVFWDGRVTMCCVDVEGKLVVGDVRKTPLSEIWRGSELQRARSLHRKRRFSELSLCGPCTVIYPWEDGGAMSEE